MVGGVEFVCCNELESTCRGPMLSVLLPHCNYAPVWSLPLCTVDAFFGAKAAGTWADHSPPSSATVVHGWSSTSTPPIYLHGADRDYFTRKSRITMAKAAFSKKKTLSISTRLKCQGKTSKVLHLVRHVCVRPSVPTEQLGSNSKDFHEILYLGIFRKSTEKIKVSFKS
jgi:hypothetical protein